MEEFKGDQIDTSQMLSSDKDVDDFQSFREITALITDIHNKFSSAIDGENSNMINGMF